MSSNKRSGPRPSDGPKPVPKSVPRDSQGPIRTPPRYGETSSLGKRCFDLFFVAGYLTLFGAISLIVLTHCESVFPEDVGGIALRQPICKNVKSVVDLLGPLPALATHWCDNVFKGDLDGIFKLANLLVTWPLALALALGFLGGFHWVEKLGFFHSAFLMYTMAVVDSRVFDSFEFLKNPFAASVSHQQQVAALVLGFFTLFPLTVVYRLSGPNAFLSKPSGGCLCGATCFLANLFFLAWFFAAAVALYEFSVKNIEGWKSFPSLSEHTSGLLEQMGPMGDKIGQQVKEAADVAFKTASQLVSTTLAAVEHLGESVIKMMKKDKTA